MNKFWAGCLGFVLSFGLVITLSFYVNIIISETDSHHKHYFLHLPYCKPKLYNHTVFYSQWYGKNIIKQIVGVEGDKVWYSTDGCLWVNDRKIGCLKSHSQKNQVLTPIVSQVIPEGYVFLYSDHEWSFDSRYQELGLVPLSSLQGKVIPLL